jgi:hypothetical protein
MTFAGIAEILLAKALFMLRGYKTSTAEEGAATILYNKKIYFLWCKIIKHTGYSAQVIWNSAINPADKKAS